MAVPSVMRSWAWLVGVLVLLVGAAVPAARAQEVAPRADDLSVRRDTFDVRHDQPFQLAPFVVPGSERLTLGRQPLDSTDYRLDYRHGRLYVSRPPTRTDTLLVAVYRTLPFDFQDVYRRRSIARLEEADSAGRAQVVEERAAGAEAFDPFAGTRLQRSGSISRGIIAGNNRDATLESGLRLELEGEVAEGVEVQAVLTDENTPIVPEGTTQRLDEFDRVFIQVATDRGTAQLGDFDLVLGETEFARFSRKLQGATIYGDLPDPASPVFGGGQAVVAGATTRGIFRSQDIEPLDGVQGPYRLEGAGGEQFIIVIPGSENVYLDGQLLTRGETNDYVVDYATGEITFTARRLITDDRRITVEFQYRTNQFTRTLLGTQVQTRFWQRPDGEARAHLGVTVLREADSQEFDEEFGFTPLDSALVAGAGDGLALRSGAEPVPFDPEAAFVQYRQVIRDADLDGRVDTFFQALEQAPADTVTVYRVRFTRVGAGEGAYQRVGRGVNGILYEYRGAGRGDYLPVRVLPKPKRQRLLDLSGRFAPVRGVEVFGEWAGSVNDQNRLSTLDDENDEGYAYLSGARLDAVPVWGEATLSAEVRRRFTSATFTTFERTRPVEFGRKWNLGTRRLDATGGVASGGDEVTDEAFVQLNLSPASLLRAEVGRLDLEGAFTSQRLAGRLTLEEERWPLVAYTVEQIDSEDALVGEEGAWLRQLGTIRQPLLRRRLVPSLEVEQERRRQRVLATDSLLPSSFAFVEVRPGVMWRTETLEAGGQVEWRTEEQWAEGTLRDAATAWTVQTQLAYRPSTTFVTEATLGVRSRQFEEYFKVNAQEEDNESVVVSWNGRWQPLQRAVQANWLYEAQTERTPTLQEIYVQTGPQRGAFVWVDENENGIREIEEFLPERTPDEGTYVRTFIPSDSLQSVIGVQARLRLAIEPDRLWPTAETWWQRALRQVSSRTSVEVQEKSREPDLRQIYLLNLSRFRDPVTTLSGRLRLTQDLTLFKRQSKYGLDLSFNQVRALSERAAGEEEQFLNLWRSEAQWRPSTAWTVSLDGRWERNRLVSDSLSTRRYDIRTTEVAPELAFRPSRAWQLSAGAAYGLKRDAFDDRTATLVKLPLEVRLNRARSFSVTGRFELADVRLTGEAAGLAQFELTDGRGPGQSYLWGLNAQYALNRYLRATLAYDGRAPAEAPVLHTVRMQFSAVF